jgi:hypothetical protein
VQCRVAAIVVVAAAGSEAAAFAGLLAEEGAAALVGGDGLWGRLVVAGNRMPVLVLIGSTVVWRGGVWLGGWSTVVGSGSGGDAAGWRDVVALGAWWGWRRAVVGVVDRGGGRRRDVVDIVYIGRDARLSRPRAVVGLGGRVGIARRRSSISLEAGRLRRRREQLNTGAGSEVRLAAFSAELLGGAAVQLLASQDVLGWKNLPVSVLRAAISPLAGQAGLAIASTSTKGIFGDLESFGEGAKADNGADGEGTHVVLQRGVSQWESGIVSAEGLETNTNYICFFLIASLIFENGSGKLIGFGFFTAVVQTQHWGSGTGYAAFLTFFYF